METFTDLKEFAENPHYQMQRAKSLRNLSDEMIDRPIVDLINGFNNLPYCFTLQSCYGHFVYSGKDSHNLDSLPATDAIKRVEYRIAYVALCIENSALGRDLLTALQEITVLNPENIQLGCAEWFWERQINSYTLQVEPGRFKYQDTAILDYPEALHIEKVRNRFFWGLDQLLQNSATD